METRTDGARRIGAMLIAAAIAIASWSSLPERAAGDQVDVGLKTAFATFATARALNAAISLLQSAQLSAQLGVGVSARPGELLDPVNDLIEQFSNFMLAATVAFGIQKVLLAVGGHWVVPLALSVVVACWIGYRAAARAPPRWLAQVFVLLLLVRFAVPVATLGTEVLFDAFLAPEYQASQRSLAQIEGQADAERQPPADAGQGAVATVREWFAKGADLGAQAEKISAAASRLAEHVTQLIVVFVLQTLVFPVALVWLLWRALRLVFRPPGAPA